MSHAHLNEQLSFSVPRVAPASTTPLPTPYSSVQVDPAPKLFSIHEPNPPKEQPFVQDTEFNFITVTNPIEAQRQETRRYVRTRVMQKYHTKRRLSQAKWKTASESNRVLAPKTTYDHSLTSLAEPVALPTALRFPKQPSLSTYFDAGLFDTFSVLPVALSSDDRFFLDRYIDFAYNLDVLIDAPGKKKPMTNCYLPAAIKDPITLYSILLTGAQCQEKADQEQRSHHQARYYARFYHGRLLQLINQAIGDGEKRVSDSLVAGLVKLEVDAYLDGDQKQFDLHANAVRTIVRLCGGLSVLGMQGFLSELVLRVDQSAASYFASQPYFPQALPPPLCLSVEALNVGFLSPTVINNLSEEMINLLTDLCTISATMNSTGGTLPESGSISWESAGECEKSLMMLCAQRKREPHFVHIPSIQECICLAAELYWMRIVRGYSISIYGGPLASKALLESLTSILSAETYLETYHGQVGELLLWSAFMGSLAIDTPNGIRDWTEMISCVAQRLRIHSWEEAKPILQKFLWLVPRSESLGKASWAQVEILSSTYSTKFQLQDQN